MIKIWPPLDNELLLFIYKLSWDETSILFYRDWSTEKKITLFALWFEIIDDPYDLVDGGAFEQLLWRCLFRTSGFPDCIPFSFAVIFLFGFSFIEIRSETSLDDAPDGVKYLHVANGTEVEYIIPTTL